MLSWLGANLGTIVVGLTLLAVVSLIVIHLVKTKKAGKSSCGCGCADCSMCGRCHPTTK